MRDQTLKPRDELLALAIDAVERASHVCRDVQGRLDELRAITKDDDSPVTVGDFAAQAVVASLLRERLGSVVLVGEESSAFLRQPEHAAHLEATLRAAAIAWPDADIPALLDAIDLGTQDPTSGEGFWTLDPIDGTKGFLRGQQYAIALAYVEAGAPVVAAMATPNLPASPEAPIDTPDPLGTIFAATTDHGTTETISTMRLADRSGEAPTSLRVCASVERAHSSGSKTDAVMEHVARAAGIERVEKVRLDSQAKYAVVARGQADAYLRLPKKSGYVERIWDHAAGALIASEAGCVVSDISGKPLDFGHGRGLETNQGIVCAPPGLHALLIRAIRETGSR